MAAAHDVQALLMHLSHRGKLRIAQEVESPPSASRALSLAWPGLDAVLPDGGLPRGVIELSSPRALGGCTSLVLAAVRAGQARSANAWCAWLDPEATLHAPGVFAAGVDLDRLLVVRSPRAQLARVAVKVVASGGFEVVVIDFDAMSPRRSRAGVSSRSTRRPPTLAPEVIIRKLALAAEPCGATVILITDALRPRAVPWPVAMRVDLSRPNARELVVRVAKDKRGRVGLARTVPFLPVLDAAV